MSDSLTVKVGNLTVRVDELAELQKLLEAARRGEVPAPQAGPPSVEMISQPTTPDLDLLRKAGLSSITIGMVTRKVLGIEAMSKRLEPDYPAIKQAAATWLQREITDKIQFLYVSLVDIPVLGTATAVVGLNAENRLVVLALEVDKDVKRVLRTVITRGLKGNFGLVLGSNEQVDADVMETFPKAPVLRCWLNIASRMPQRHKEIIKALEKMPSLKDAQKALGNVPADLSKLLKPFSKDLLAYYQYDPKLWRALRRSPMYRLQEELRVARLASDERSAWLLTTWACLRLQYQWQRIPVDSSQLDSLKYMKAEVSTGPSSNSRLRRRPAQSTKES